MASKSVCSSATFPKRCSTKPAGLFTLKPSADHAMFAPSSTQTHTRAHTSAHTRAHTCARAGDRARAHRGARTQINSSAHTHTESSLRARGFYCRASYREGQFSTAAVQQLVSAAVLSCFTCLRVLLNNQHTIRRCWRSGRGSCCTWSTHG